MEGPRIDPRTFSPAPAFIAFKAVNGASCFGFYPAEGDKETNEQIYTFLASKTIFTQSMSFKEFLIQNVKTPKSVGRIGFANGNMVCLRECQGQHGSALSHFVWDLPYCPSASRDWLTGALTTTQQLHITYKLELLDRVVQKITISKIIGAYGITKAANYKKLEKRKLKQSKNCLRKESNSKIEKCI